MKTPTPSIEASIEAIEAADKTVALDMPYVIGDAIEGLASSKFALFVPGMHAIIGALATICIVLDILDKPIPSPDATKVIGQRFQERAKERVRRISEIVDAATPEATQ